MKKLLIAGVLLTLAPAISFAQTSATGTTQALAPTPVATVEPGLVPGDFFYFLDNWRENLRLAFTFNKEAKAKLHLQYAKERVAEMKDVLAKPDAKLEDVASAKANFDAQIADAATLVKTEKDSGANVADLARELDDELDQSRTELKDVLQGHQGDQGRAEAEIRAKLTTLPSSDPQVQGLTQALESITKEKDTAHNEENNIDANLSDAQALFEEIMGPQMAAEKHLEQAARFRAELQAIDGQVPPQASEQLMKQAQEAMKRGDFEAAKRISKDAERGLENAKMMRGDMEMPALGIPNASGTMMNSTDGADVGATHVDDLEQGINDGEKMMEGLDR